MTSFQKKLEKILKNGSTVLNESDQERFGTDSPTHVCPEKGEEVTTTLDGTGKIDATRPIKTGSAATLKTTPGVSATEGPTGHIPTNSDLPRGQKDGLGTSNGPGKNSLPPTPKIYGLHEEEEEEEEKAKKLKEEEEEKKHLPPFMKKKKSLKEEEEEKRLKEEEEKRLHEEEEEEEEKAKKLKEEEEEEKKLKEESETDAAKTLKRPQKGSGEKADKVKEEFDHEEGDRTKSVKEEEEEDKKEDKKAVKEATDALFSGETISEVLKEKTAVIFEATLSKRIKDYRGILNNRYTKKLNERVEQIREELSESVSGHLDLVVEHWVKENELPLEQAIKSELVEDFITGLKTLFEEHYIELPQEKIDVVSEMVVRINKLETKLNEQIESNVKLQKEVKAHERSQIFDKVAKGMVSTKVEKLKNLSESVEFRNPQQFESALSTLKGSVDSVSIKPNTQKTTLSEQVLDQSLDPVVPGSMITSLKGTLARMAKN